MTMAREPSSRSNERAPSLEDEQRHAIDRRAFLQLSALAGAGATLGWSRGAAAEPDVDAASTDPFESELEEKTIAELQALMTDGELTSRRLVRMYSHSWGRQPCKTPPACIGCATRGL
jgi:hypothetical protein